MKETPYEPLKDNEKKTLGNNEEDKMTIYNALPRKEYKRVFMSKTVKERAKVTAIEEAKDLATLYLDELIGNLKVYEMVLDNDGVASKTTKEKVKSLDLKDKVTREQTSDDSNCQEESDEDVDEEEAEAFNMLARNFRKFFRKGNQFGHGNQFGNEDNRFGKGRSNSFEDKGGESSKKKGACYNEEHGAIVKTTTNIKTTQRVSWRLTSSSFIDLNIIDLHKENGKLLKFNKYFTKTFEKLLKEKHFLKDKNSKLSSKINDLEIEVKKLYNKEVVEPCQKCVELTQEVDSLTSNVSKLQDEALNISKFKSSSIALDDILSRQKLSQDKEGLGFSKKMIKPLPQVCFKCDVLPDDWIVDSGCTKNLTGNRRLFTSYKAYDGGHVVFGSNLKGKVIGGGNINHDSITITNVEHVSGLAFNMINVSQLCDDDCVVSFTKVDYNISKNGRMLAKGHRRNGLYTCKLGDKSKQQICLASVVDNSTLWHRRLGHANMRLVRNLASNELVRNIPKLSFERHFCDICGLGRQVHLTKFDPESYEGVLLGFSQTSKAYIVLNKEIMRIEESLNVSFDESLPEPKSSSSVEDDRIDEPIVQDLNGSPSLQANVSDEGYPKSLKEARC
ncbi:retrotransposon protein [Tanacetum coccineum]